MVMTRGMILATLKDYANPDTKLSRLVKEGKYFPLGKGPYIKPARYWGATDLSVSYKPLPKGKYLPSFTRRDNFVSGLA